MEQREEKLEQEYKAEVRVHWAMGLVWLLLQFQQGSWKEDWHGGHSDYQE